MGRLARIIGWAIYVLFILVLGFIIAFAIYAMAVKAVSSPT
jgi:hypothetical protein